MHPSSLDTQNRVEPTTHRHLTCTHYIRPGPRVSLLPSTPDFQNLVHNLNRELSRRVLCAEEWLQPSIVTDPMGPTASAANSWFLEYLDGMHIDVAYYLSRYSNSERSRLWSEEVHGTVIMSLQCQAGDHVASEMWESACAGNPTKLNSDTTHYTEWLVDASAADVGENSRPEALAYDESSVMKTKGTVMVI